MDHTAHAPSGSPKPWPLNESNRSDDVVCSDTCGWKGLKTLWPAHLRDHCQQIKVSPTGSLHWVNEVLSNDASATSHVQSEHSGASIVSETTDNLSVNEEEAGTSHSKPSFAHPNQLEFSSNSSSSPQDPFSRMEAAISGLENTQRHILARLDASQEILSVRLELQTLKDTVTRLEIKQKERDLPSLVAAKAHGSQLDDRFNTLLDSLEKMQERIARLEEQEQKRANNIGTTLDILLAAITRLEAIENNSGSHSRLDDMHHRLERIEHGLNPPRVQKDISDILTIVYDIDQRLSD